MRNAFLLFGLTFLFVFEILRVYLIMPMPGSQEFDSIELAYFLGSNKILIRTFGLIVIAFPLYYVLRYDKLKSKILIGIFLLLYLSIFYVFNFKMEADKMFYQPTVINLSSADSNKIAKNKLVIGIVLNGEARAYPIQLIGYHHQVVDTINSVPVMVTYCTVCRTGRVFNPVVNGKYEKFRLVGMDHFNAMFEDETTKSWWRQRLNGCRVLPREQGKPPGMENHSRGTTAGRTATSAARGTRVPPASFLRQVTGRMLRWRTSLEVP